MKVYVSFRENARQARCQCQTDNGSKGERSQSQSCLRSGSSPFKSILSNCIHLRTFTSFLPFRRLRKRRRKSIVFVTHSTRIQVNQTMDSQGRTYLLRSFCLVTPLLTLVPHVHHPCQGAMSWRLSYSTPASIPFHPGQKALPRRSHVSDVLSRP